MTDLKPCPFCGVSAAEVCTAKELEDCKRFESVECPLCEEDECHAYTVVCNVQKGGCGASGAYKTTRDDAVKAWNTRKGESDADSK